MKHRILRIGFFKRLLAMMMVMLMIVSLFTTVIEPAHASADPYYDEFGITYNQLYTLYPNYLSPAQEKYVLRVFMDEYLSAMDSYGGVYDFLPSFLFALDEGGMDILIGEFLSKFDLGESLEEQLISDTSEALMRALLQKDDALLVVSSEIADNYDSMTSVYDIFTGAGEALFKKDLKASCKHLSDDEVDELVNDLFEQETKLIDLVGDGIELWQLIVAIVELHDIQVESVCQLRDALEDNSDLAEALDNMLIDIELDPVTYILKNFCSNKVLEMISEAIKSVCFVGLDHWVHMAPGTLATALGQIVISGAIHLFYKGAMADDLYQTVLLSEYVSEIGVAITTHKTEFVLAKNKGVPIGQDDVEEYQYLYSAYITTIHETLKSALAIAKSEEQISRIENALALCEQFTYEKYILWCMTSVKNDISAGVIAPPGASWDNAEACIEKTFHSYGTVAITKDNANIMDRPCSVNTDMNAKLIEQAKLGNEYVATAYCENIKGNIWYQITTSSGEVGYVYSGNCEYTPGSDAIVAGLSVPSELSVGSRFWLQGTISTQYTTIVSVSFDVYDKNGLWQTGGTETVNGKSYDLSNSAVDTATEFNILKAGAYRCELSAVISNFAQDGAACEKVVLYTSDLLVGTLGSDSAEDKLIYRDLLLNINYAEITKVGYQPHETNSCGCFAMAYCRTLLDGEMHHWYEYNFNTLGELRGGEFDEATHNDASAWWTPGNYEFKPCDSKAEAFTYMYNELVAGRPVVALVRGNYADAKEHFVAVVGFQNVTSLETLSEANFLILDSIHHDHPDGGIIAREDVENMPCKDFHNYSLLQSGEGKYLLVVSSTKEAGIGYTASGSCEHIYSAEEVTATCTTDGMKIYACDNCGDTYSEPIPALGHDYDSIHTEATCGSLGYTTYICTRCGDNYIEYEDASWSQWSTEYPAGIPESLIQEKTQYSVLLKEYTTSTSDSLEGWTYCGTTFGDWSEVKTTTEKPTESDTLQIIEVIQTGWGYYHWCNYYYNGGNNWNVDSIAYGSQSYWHGYTSSFELPAIAFQDQGGQQAYGGYGTGAYPCDYNFYIWFRNADADVYTYSYKTREEVNLFYRWAEEWSDWSDDEVVSNENCQVKTQKLYRYYSGELADHTYEAVVVEPTCTTAGSTTYTCDLCGDSYTEEIPATGHAYSSIVTAPTCTAAGSTTYTCHCGDTYTEEIPALGHSFVGGTCTNCGAPESEPGDANGDGKVNARDARLILRYAASLITDEEIDSVAADFNGDGKINARDARALLRAAAGLH